MPKLIKLTEMMPMLVEACPTFAEPLREHREYFEEDLLYPQLGEFAHHLVDLYKNGNTEAFGAVFDLAERFQVEGDESVREAATIGLLEGIQNVAGNRGIDPEQFATYLRPTSLKWWNQLNKFWIEEIGYVGETIDEES